MHGLSAVADKLVSLCVLFRYWCAGRQAQLGRDFGHTLPRFAHTRPHGMAADQLMHKSYMQVLIMHQHAKL